MRKLSFRGHEVEFVEHREIVDFDGTLFHQFTFAVDGKLVKPWEIPTYHRHRFEKEEEFEDFLARSAVSFAQSSYNTCEVQS